MNPSVGKDPRTGKSAFSWSRAITILLGLLILAVIYWRIDFTRILGVLGRLDTVYLGLGLFMFLPLIGSVAYRMQIMLPGPAVLPFKDAVGLVLSGQVLNMVLPSKMGDIAKLFFIEKRGYADRGLAFALVIFERICDVLALLFWGLVGLWLFPDRDDLLSAFAFVIGAGLVGGGVVLASPGLARLQFRVLEWIAPDKFKEKIHRLREAWFQMQAYFWEHPLRTTGIVGLSIVQWFFNLAQIWVFALAIGSVPLVANLALAPLAILTGLLPITFAGIGTRDAAMIYFYEPYLGADGAAALGLLTSLRYFIPALMGLPVFMKYLNEMPVEMKGGSPASPADQSSRN